MVGQFLRNVRRRDNRMVILKSMSYKGIMRICYSLMGKINVMV